MPNKRYKAEQIVTLLRQIEVGIANGKTTPQVCKEAGALRPASSTLRGKPVSTGLAHDWPNCDRAYARTDAVPVRSSSLRRLCR